MKLLKVLGKVAQAAAPVAVAVAMPHSIINTAVGAVVKHATPVNNQSIPVLNLVASTLYYYVPTAIQTHDWVSPIVPALQQGGALAAGSTALHQFLKIPLAENVTGPIATKVGPGDKFSL